MTKKIFAVCISVLVCFSAVLTSFAAELDMGDVEDIISLREEAGKEITVTDVRNELSSVGSEYTKAQLEEILTIVNDAAADTEAEPEYYAGISTEFSSSEINSICDAVNGISQSVSGDQDSGSSVDTEDEADSGSENTLSSPVSGIDMKIVAILGGSVAVLAIIAVVLLIVLKTLKKNKNSGHDETYPPPYDRDQRSFTQDMQMTDTQPQTVVQDPAIPQQREQKGKSKKSNGPGRITVSDD